MPGYVETCGYDGSDYRVGHECSECGGYVSQDCKYEYVLNPDAAIFNPVANISNLEATIFNQDAHKLGGRRRLPCLALW